MSTLSAHVESTLKLRHTTCTDNSFLAAENYFNCFIKLFTVVSSTSYCITVNPPPPPLHFLVDWDLVTWSKDRVLHIWPLGEELKMDLCGDYLGEDVGEDMIDPSFDLSGGHVDMSLSTEGDNVEHSSTNLDKSVSPMVTRSLREGQLAGSLPRSSPMKSMGSLPRNDSPVSLARTPSGPHVFQPQTAHTLAQEFSLLNLDNVTHLEIETVSVPSNCN